MTPRPARAPLAALLVTLLAGCDGGSVQRGDGRIYPGGGYFGRAVVLDGGRMLASAYETNQAFVLERTPNGWAERATLRPPSTVPSGALFGWLSVGIEDDVAVVGSHISGITSETVSGLAYVYERGAGGWALASELSLPQPEERGQRRESFGLRVAVSDGRVAVASRGVVTIPENQVVEPPAVLIYERSAEGWVEAARVEERDRSPLGRSRGFASGMDLDGDRLAVSSNGQVSGGVEGGGDVRVFERGSGDWPLVATLAAPAPVSGDGFGKVVALDGPLLAVSAINRANAVGAFVGSVFVFRETAGVWAFEAELQPGDLRPLDSYGQALAVQSSPGGNRVAVSAAGRNRSQGAVFVWARGPGGAWALEAELAPEGYGRGTAFGEGVALEGGRLVAGAIFAAGERGGVFEFRRGPDGWAQAFE